MKQIDNKDFAERIVEKYSNYCCYYDDTVSTSVCSSDDFETFAVDYITKALNNIKATVNVE